MVVNGKEIPEWIVRNNSVEAIEKWVNQGKILTVDDVAKEEYVDDNWGIYIVRADGVPAIVALKLTEDQAATMATKIQTDHPKLHIEIFESFLFDKNAL